MNKSQTLKCVQAAVVAPILLFSSEVGAATSQVELSLGGTTIKDNTGATALTSGDPVVNGDGALIEIGYFSGGVGSFDGTWVAIAGASSSNPLLDITVGDFTAQDGSTPIPDGNFQFGVVFTDADLDLPAGDAQLSVRFYDGLTLGASSYYNTATNAAWTFNALSDTPPTPTLIDFDSTSAAPVWEDSANPFETSITIVPEPSSFALLGLGGLGFLLRRRR